MKSNFIKLFLFIYLSVFSIQADFFAFKKLVHLDTKNIVYLLYDLHASVEADIELSINIFKDINNILDKKSLCFVELYNYRLAEIDKQIDLFRNNLPNLIKQHTDLINVVKNYNISLVDEDWSGIENAQDHISKWWGYVKRKIGIQENYKECRYRKGVTPMSGIGRKLLDKFSLNKFEPLNGNNYFYNPDFRDSALFSSDNREIDNRILKAINKLFEQYNQNKIIVAVGYEHGIRIAAELILKCGYIQESFIISEDLIKQRKTSYIVDRRLKEIETNTIGQEEFRDFKNHSDYVAANYKLISNPLDINAIFAKELV